MWARLRRSYLILGCGASFAIFMIGGVFLALAVIPVCRLLSREPDVRRRRVQRIISRSFCLHLAFMRLIRVMKECRFRGWENLRSGGPFLIVANHPTLLDVVALISRLPEVDCVIKKEVWDHKCMGGAVRGADYIFNGGAQFVSQALDRLKRGHSILLFPEGTRSPLHGLRPFLRGAARLALESGAKIIPVVIRCDPPFLMKGQAWWEVPDRPVSLSLDLGTPEEIPLPVGGAESCALRARELTASMEDYFRSKLTYASA